MYLAGRLELISNVLAIRKYAVIAALTAAGLGAAYFFLTMSLLPTHMDAASEEYGGHIAASVALTAVIAALGGVNIAMIAFKMKRMRMMSSAKSGGAAFLGGAFSAFTPGCPACTAPLAVILGAVGGLSIFPMQGLELKLVSVGVLVFSIYWITGGLQRPSCCSIKK